MNWVFGTFLAVSLIHMGEEYFYPGGFLDFMKRLNPRFASQATPTLAVVINGLQLLLCIAAVLVGERNLVFSLSIAGLLLVNGLMHVGGSIRMGGYTPGLITGIALYLPLSIYGYSVFLHSGQLTLLACIATVILGVLYQAVPIVYLALSAKRRASFARQNSRG